MRHRRHPAGHIDGTAEPVPGKGHRTTRCGPNAKAGQIIGGGGVHEIQHRRNQRQRIRAHEHHRIADRLDEPHRREGHVMGEFGQPTSHVLKLLGRQRLA